MFTVWGPIARSDLAGLCDRVCGVLAAAAGAPVAVCEVRGVEPDAVTVDALARLQLAAGRAGAAAACSCAARRRRCSSWWRSWG